MKRDLTGLKFNKLTVLNYYGPNNFGRAKFLCICDCGQKTIVDGASLTCNNTKSCGCAIRDQQFKSIENKAFYIHQDAAKIRDIPSFLNKDEYLQIARQPCVYCNKFSKRKNRQTKAILELNSVDRRNNEPFYKIENCQSTCFVCQKMKGSLLHKDFIEHIQFIKNNT